MSGETRISALILAAGSSSRMKGSHKLLEDLHGRPVIRWVVDTALSSAAEGVTVVVGHNAEEVLSTLPEGVRGVHNPEFAAGLSSSLSAGIRALDSEVDGLLVLLGDMPFVTIDTCDALIGAFEAGRACVPIVAGRRGNPVLWSRAFFDEIVDVEGDRGARELLIRHSELVTEIAIEDQGPLVDIDDPSDLTRARGRSDAQPIPSA